MRMRIMMMVRAYREDEEALMQIAKCIRVLIGYQNHASYAEFLVCCISEVNDTMKRKQKAYGVLENQGDSHYHAAVFAAGKLNKMAEEKGIPEFVDTKNIGCDAMLRLCVDLAYELASTGFSTPNDPAPIVMLKAA